MKGRLKDSCAVRRQARGTDVGPAERSGRQNDRREAFARLRSLVFVHEFPDGRNIGQPRIAFFAGLHQYADKTIFDQPMQRFASEQGFYGDAAAMDLFALDGQVDFRTIFVAGERIEFCSEGFLQ